MVKGADANTTTGEGTFTFFSTPSAYVFKMLNSGFGDNIVKTEFSEVLPWQTEQKHYQLLQVKMQKEICILCLLMQTEIEIVILHYR